METFQNLLEDYLSKQEGILRVGDRVEGKIVHLGKEYAYVDIGDKREALLPMDEIKDSLGNVLFGLGEEIQALITGRAEREGSYLLSMKKILEEKVRSEIKEAQNKEEPIKVKMVKPIKGGFEIVYKDIVKGFLPKSQAPQAMEKDLPVLIISFDEKNFVVSHKAYLERERELKLKDLERRIKERAILTGIVKGVVKGGYLLEFDGILTGYLPFSEVTRRRIKNIELLLKEGDVIKVKVVEWKPEAKRLKVSAKVLEPDPWLKIEERYKLGEPFRGRITKVENFGAFVELEPGLEGLLPASEISWKRGIKPKDILKEEDFIEGVILELNPEKRKLILSLKRLEESPWESFRKKVKVGDIISGKIKSITDFGLFVEIMEGVEGFVHISQVSWDRVENLHELFQIGEEVQAKILAIKEEEQKLLLSIKETKEDPWNQVLTKYKEGDLVEGRVIKEIPGKGYIVKLEEGINGFLPIKEVSEEVKKEKSFLQIGKSVQGKIILIDAEKKRLWFSQKAYLEDLEKKEVEAYKKGVVEKGIRLSELFKNKFEGK